MNKRHSELSNTEALVRQGLRPARLKLPADDWSRGHIESADMAVTGPQPGRFRRETGAGSESLACAKQVCDE